MSGAEPLIQLDEGDFAALVEGGFVVEESEDGSDPGGLQALSRRISGQYVEVLAAYAGAAFHGRATDALQSQVEAALGGLTRLAEASEDVALATCLGRLGILLPQTAVMGGQRRRDFMRELSDWVLEFSDLLEPEDADRLRGLVRFDMGSLPLLDRLSSVRGIGPKRLQRLYSAGLFSVDVVAGAEVRDVASVTGLPETLARRVVQAAQEFAEEERRSVARDLKRRSAQLRQALGELNDDEERQRVIAAALEAMNEIREALAAFSHEEGS